MSLVLDVILVAIVAICVIMGVKRGFFKTVASFASGILALLLAFTFTPKVGAYLGEKFILPSLSSSIFTTLSSIAEDGVNSVGEAVYDLTRLSESDQFRSILNRCGADSEYVSSLIEKAEVGGKDMLEKVADAVASPISDMLSKIIAFIAIFVVSLIALRIVVWLVGLVFEMPVLKEADKTMGLVFGILCAVLFVQVYANFASSAMNALSAAFPATFSKTVIEDTLILKHMAQYNFVDAIFRALKM